MVFERAERRAEVTGRHIPRAVVRESVEATRHSVRALAVKADYVATINNETAVPILEAFETIDRTGRWSLISSRFGYTLPDYNEFPQSLAPSVLKDANVDGQDLFLDAGTKKLLSSFTKVNFDWQALGSIDSGSCGKHTRNLPVLVMSGRCFEVLLVTAVEVGVDVSELLRRHGTSSQAALQRLATYLMDPNSVPSLDQSARESGRSSLDQDEEEEEQDMPHWAMASAPSKAKTRASKLRFSPPGIINLDSESRDVAASTQAFYHC